MFHFSNQLLHRNDNDNDKDNDNPCVKFLSKQLNWNSLDLGVNDYKLRLGYILNGTFYGILVYQVSAHNLTCYKIADIIMKQKCF